MNSTTVVVRDRASVYLMSENSIQIRSDNTSTGSSPVRGRSVLSFNVVLSISCQPYETPYRAPQRTEGTPDKDEIRP